MSSNRNSRGNLAEFGPALSLFFLFMLIPSLFLIRLGMSTAAIYFIVDRAVATAAKTPTYDSAVSRANEVVHALTSSPIGRFSGLKIEGIKQLNLYVDEHVTATDSVNVLTKEQLLRQTVSPEVNTYEYDLQSSYAIEPLLPGCRLPLLGAVPLLGAPAVLTVRAVRVVEYPEGLRLSASISNGGRAI